MFLFTVLIRCVPDKYTETCYYLDPSAVKENNLKNEQKERVIADFIAGMTDRYAVNLYKKIK